MSELLPTVQAGKHPEQPGRLSDDHVRADRRGRPGRARPVPVGPGDGHVQGPVCPAAVAVPPGGRRAGGTRWSGTRGSPRTGIRRRRSPGCRLRSPGVRRRPQPTLVTTGTGSGKTEAFLYPILDHVLRARRDGITGTKALILYPMNALANDQAQRLADIITDSPRAGGGHRRPLHRPDRVRPRTVGHRGRADHRPGDHPGHRAGHPADQLQDARPAAAAPQDQRLWRQSATSLQYLVLDEFHTYDGAQGTDVAMLLRRLGLALKSHWPSRRPDDHRRGPVPAAGSASRRSPPPRPWATRATPGRCWSFARDRVR